MEPETQNPYNLNPMEQIKCFPTQLLESGVKAGIRSRIDRWPEDLVSGFPDLRLRACGFGLGLKFIVSSTKAWIELPSSLLCSTQ